MNPADRRASIFFPFLLGWGLRTAGFAHRECFFLGRVLLVCKALESKKPSHTWVCVGFLSTFPEVE